MKFTKSIARIATTLLCLFVVASSSFAATNPLNDPTALAVDAKGNLWVANQGGNNILKFSPSYVFQPKATITQGINAPTGIAFDTVGNLWVVNSAESDVTEYTNGVQNTAATITGITNPLGIAIDGLGNLWVSNQFSNVNVYVNNSPSQSPSVLLQTFTPGTPVYGIAIVNGSLAWGTLSQAVLTPAEQALTSGPTNFVIPNSKTSITVAGTPTGVVYMANIDGSVDVYTPATKTTTQFLNLGAVPPGIAIDTLRGRVYLANGAANTISVYNTAGQLLHTIQ